MPLISDKPETKKDKIIRNIRQLPDDLIDEFYTLDLISFKGSLEWNQWLADKYKAFGAYNKDKDFLRFEIGSWVIKMECENEEL